MSKCDLVVAGTLWPPTRTERTLCSWHLRSIAANVIRSPPRQHGSATTTANASERKAHVSRRNKYTHQWCAPDSCTPSERSAPKRLRLGAALNSPWCLRRHYVLRFRRMDTLWESSHRGRALHLGRLHSSTRQPLYLP